MKLFLSTSEKTNIRNFMRSCGYAELRDHRTGAISYAKSLSGRAYPRFHAYLEEPARIATQSVAGGRGTSLVINLHLDQKQASYEGHTAHSGEYDGDLVVREAERIKSAHEGMVMRRLSPEMKKNLEPKKEKGFFARLLGR